MNKMITQSDLYSSREEFVHYSVSKIKSYKECSEMYKLRYVNRVDTYKASTSTVIGTLLHNALEYLYGTVDDDVHTALDAFYKTVEPSLVDLGIGDACSLLGELLDYNNDINNLYIRASEGYNGADAIRTKAGKVPKSPEMTGIWKEECRRLNLNARKDRIDRTIQNSTTGLEEVSITDAFAKAYILADAYTTPPEFDEVLYVELPITRWNYQTNILYNPILFPGCEYPDVYLNGYIDNVSKLNINGRIVNAVIDYKTSKEEFNESIVAHNQQLLVYARGAEELLDIPIDYIGILSLPQNKLVYAEVDRELQQLVLDNYNEVIRNSHEKNFIKHVPDSKYSPCLSSFGGRCPFLEHCWPKSYAYFSEVDREDTIDVAAYLP